MSKKTILNILGAAVLGLLVIILVVVRFPNISNFVALQRYGPTPDVPGYGQPAEDSQWPWVLDCSLITHLRPGQEWGGVQIGVTTFEEMVALYDADMVYWHPNYGHLLFEMRAGRRGSLDWSRVETCFIGNTLAAIEGDFPFAFPGDLDEFIAEYGIPDIVTWNDDVNTRSFFYAEDGMLAIAEHIVEGDVFGPDGIARVIFISPMSMEELKQSEMISAIPTPETSRYSEDPWGFTSDD